MADNTVLSAAIGTGDTIATDDIGGVKYQIVKEAFGALDTATLVTSSVGLPTDPLDRAARDCGKVDIAMGQGAHDAPGAAIDPVGTSGWASAAAPTDVTADGDIVKSWCLRNGAQATVLTAAGALIGGDATNGIDVDVTRVTGTVTIAGAVTNAGTFAVQVDGTALTRLTEISTNTSSLVGATYAEDTALAPGSTGILGLVLRQDTPGNTSSASGDVEVLQMSAGRLWVDPSGVTLTVASHAVTNAGTFATQAAQSGTWTVQPGNTANTTPWLVSMIPATSGGLTISHLISAATTNLTNVKASAGQLYGWSIFNTNASVRYVKLHNTAGSPTAGTGVVYTIGVPAGGGTNIDLAGGLVFSTGIAFSTVTEAADSGTTAVGAGDLIINLHWK